MIKKIKLSTVVECELRRMNTLPFVMKYGACNVFSSHKNEKVWMCFTEKDKRGCRL